ncbi:MAG: cyclic nucleotide-binding domain-containing protein [Elusimicrobia bacterium]|nr:cyclic nucleotide-binding domain-containing protein [Elusimicrobiota bacterium]
MPFDDTLFLKRSVDVLGFFDVEQLKRITPDIVHSKYKKGQTVMLAGEFSANFFIIKNGSINIFTKENPKDPAMTLKKGDFFGVMNLFSGQASVVAIKAAEDFTDIIEIPYASFQKLLEMQPLLKEALLKKVEERMKGVNPQPAPPPPPTPPQNPPAA